MSIAYAQDMLSFLFLDSTMPHINQIYLFGSAVRGELEKESDIDIFIDTKAEALVEKAAKAALSRFAASKDYEKWKQFQFTYPISLQIGNLSEWQVKSSITAEGILLYAQYGEQVEGERKVLFTLVLPKQKKKYLRVVRTLFGRGEEGYKDQGLVAKVGGERLGSQVFIVPQLERKTIEVHLQKEKVEYRMKEMAVFL